MLKKILFAVVAFIATMGFAIASVDVNKADQASLESVKGIGPKKSKMILDERKKGGDFKDWADFEARVKGVKDKAAVKLSDAGLTVNGQSFSKGQSGDGKTDKKGKQDVKDSKKGSKKDETK